MTHLCLEGLKQRNGSWGPPGRGPTWPLVPVSQKALFYFSGLKSFLFNGEGRVLQVLLCSVLETSSEHLIFFSLVLNGI